MPPEERGPLAPDSAAGLFSGPGGGRGIAAGLLEFAQPLLKAAGDDQKEIDKALKFSMMIWNVAVSAENGGAETVGEQLAWIENRMCVSAEDSLAFRDMVRVMFNRYDSLRPGARVNLAGVLDGLWGRDLSRGVPRFGWRQRLMRAAMLVQDWKDRMTGKE